VTDLLIKSRLIENFVEILHQESPSFRELPLGQWLIKYFSSRNIEAFMDQCGDKIDGNCGNIIAYIKGSIEGEPLCFSAHMDQVSPCFNIKPKIEGELIRSDGTTTLGGDDKGGIVVILEALQHILEENIPHKDIFLLFTVCEEQGLLGCKYLDTSNLPVKNIVIVDAAGPAGIIAYKAPSKVSITVTFKGKKAHAGIEPEKGINAIMVAAQAISNMRIGRIDEETTSNIGRIEGGGADNIVTDEVKLTAEIRSFSTKKLNSEINIMKQCCMNSASKNFASVDFKYEVDFSAFELSKSSYIYNLCVEKFQKEGIEPKPAKIGGGSDANILFSKGYNCAIISVGMDKVHTTEETINIDDMFSTAKVIADMMAEG
jgi:tripeptide aminopeptidase